MPNGLTVPVFTVDAAKMHKIDTSNVENLHTMWTVFNKCAESMEEGRRLENLSWRLWNRETFCCDRKPVFTDPPLNLAEVKRRSKKEIPNLSCSVDSALSEDYELERSRIHSPPVTIKILSSGKNSIESLSSSSKSRKPITPQALQGMVFSIKETKIDEEQGMTGLPLSVTENVPTLLPSMYSSSQSSVECDEATPLPDIPLSPKRIAERRLSHPSLISTAAALSASESSAPISAACAASETGADTPKTPGIVRGFTSSSISIHRNMSHLSPIPSPAAVPFKSSLRMAPQNSSMKKGRFMLGGSSDEESSSLEDQASFQSRQPTQPLTRPTGSTKKLTSFKDEVESRTIANISHEDEDVFESDDDEEEEEEESDDEVSESAIEEEEDEDEWEDSASDAGASSPPQKELFKRVDSKPNLVSRQSLLTTMMHQTDRADAMAGMAAKSRPVLHKSATSTRGPSASGSPEDESFLEMQRANITRSKSKPVIMTTSNIHPPALSPRTTRRNMLATELTESLRKHLLWERQQKNTTANAVLKRRHTAHENLGELKKFPDGTGSATTSKNNSWTHYFDHGLGEYHSKGW